MRIMEYSALGVELCSLPSADVFLLVSVEQQQGDVELKNVNVVAGSISVLTLHRSELCSNSRVCKQFTVCLGFAVNVCKHLYRV